MTPLKRRIKYGLDESRILILGAQVLVGFDYQAVFQPGFDKLPASLQITKAVGLGVQLAALSLLMSPGPYHRIAARREDTLRFHRFITRAIKVALLPFAMTLGIDFMTAFYKVLGSLAGWIAGAGVFGAAVGRKRTPNNDHVALPTDLESLVLAVYRVYNRHCNRQ